MFPVDLALYINPVRYRRRPVNKSTIETTESKVMPTYGRVEIAFEKVRASI